MTAAVLRALADPDRPALARFFDRHPDTTLFLRGNLAQAGLRPSPHPFAGHWVAAFAGGSIDAVAAHFTAGNLVVAGGDHVASAARLAVDTSRRPVRGVIGPWAQALAALAALDLAAPPVFESRELLYRLELDRLVVPATLAAGRMQCRASHEAELDALADWRIAYEVEILARQGVPGQRAAALESVTRAHDLGRLFVLEDEAGTPVATSAFNAAADGIVQIGGVFTPPGQRGRGYARSVVAGSLLAARAVGVVRSVLFTGERNEAAQRAYAALGFEAVGDYGLLLF